MQEIFNDVIKETIYKKRLDNGLTVFMMPRTNYKKSYGIFATNYGSIDNKFLNPETKECVQVPDGIAHFLEHKLFESNEEDTFSKFASLGASVNAYTSYNRTAYLFHTSSDFIESTLTLLDFVQDPYFTEENVKKEKGIIAQEIRMYDDEANYQVYINLINALYHNYPIKIDIAGTVDSINKISKEDLYLCYKIFYNPGNMVLFLTGNFNPEKVFNLVEENQAKKNLFNFDQIERIYPDEPTTVNQNAVLRKMDVSQPLFRLGIKETIIPENMKKMVKQDIATGMLLDLLIGKSTKLYQDLYDQGLVDDHFNSYYTLEKGYGFILLGGNTKDPDLLYNKILDGFEKEIDNINNKDYNRIFKKTLGEYVERYNSFESVASDFITYHFRDINYFTLLDIIQGINLEYLINRFEEIFKKDRIVKSIIKEN